MASGDNTGVQSRVATGPAHFLLCKHSPLSSRDAEAGRGSDSGPPRAPAWSPYSTISNLHVGNPRRHNCSPSKAGMGEAQSQEGLG